LPTPGAAPKKIVSLPRRACSSPRARARGARPDRASFRHGAYSRPTRRRSIARTIADSACVGSLVPHGSRPHKDPGPNGGKAAPSAPLRHATRKTGCRRCRRTQNVHLDALDASRAFTRPYGCWALIDAVLTRGRLHPYRDARGVSRRARRGGAPVPEQRHECHQPTLHRWSESREDIVVWAVSRVRRALGVAIGLLTQDEPSSLARPRDALLRGSYLRFRAPSAPHSRRRRPTWTARLKAVSRRPGTYVAMGRRVPRIARTSTLACESPSSRLAAALRLDRNA